MPQSFTKFHTFTQALGQEKHNFTTGAGDTLRILLLNTAPSASLDAVKIDLPTDISTGGGYTQGLGLAVGTYTWNTSSGTVSMIASTDPLSFTASGASVGPFQYAVLYNDTALSDELIGYWDLGSAITLVDGQTIQFDFNVLGILSIT